MPTERDISLVLVTGAGATRSFGSGGTPLLSMPEWGAQVIKILSESDSAEVLLPFAGLDKISSPQDLEGGLGKIIRASTAFERLESEGAIELAGLGTASMKKIMAIHAALEEVITTIQNELVTRLGPDKLDLGRAQEWYAALFDTLDVGRGEAALVCATTNYDHVLSEVLLSRSGGLAGRPDTGAATDGGFKKLVDARGLLNGLPRYVPVLHLHGRLGWFLNQENQQVYAYQPEHHYNATFGLPVVLLPNDEKDYGSIQVLSSIWDEFRMALRRARRVLVVGHALGDPALVNALRDCISPKRMAVTYLPSGDEAEMKFITNARMQLGNVQLLPLDVGDLQEAQFAALEEWYFSVRGSA